MERIEALKKNNEIYEIPWQARQLEIKTACARESFAALKNAAPGERIAGFILSYAGKMETEVFPGEIIIGTDCGDLLPDGVGAEIGMVYNYGHYCPDIKMLVTLGIDGLEERIKSAGKTEATDAFLTALAAFRLMIERYAADAEEKYGSTNDECYKKIGENCRNISHNPPATFTEGLQLIWFSQMMQHIESLDCCQCSTFGRLDQILWELYSADISSDRLTPDGAVEVIAAFYLKVATSMSTQNLIVGGIDRDGKYCENELSVLFMRAQAQSARRMPSITVRVRDEMSDGLWDACLDLVSRGMGMPSFFGDKTVIRALESNGFSREEANDYCIVGCYEATPQGNTFGGTVGATMRVFEPLYRFILTRPNAGNYSDFEEQFKKYLTDEYRSTYLADCYKNDVRIAKGSAQPFAGSFIDGCVESGRMPENFGAEHHIVTMLIGGLGTLIDSLYVIKKRVYEEKAITLDDLAAALENNFADPEILYLCRKTPGKYGTNSDETNAMAKHWSEYLVSLVKNNNPFSEPNVIMYPALFIFSDDIYADCVPTPDGRRFGERYSYGAAPSEYCGAEDSLSILNSMSHVRHDLVSDGTPVAVSFPSPAVKKDGGTAKLRAMIEGYFALGGSHVYINVNDVERMKSAKRNPDGNEDIMIRISGHTERFIDLDERMQNALIERTELGR